MLNGSHPKIFPEFGSVYISIARHVNIVVRLLYIAFDSNVNTDAPISSECIIVK